MGNLNYLESHFSSLYLFFALYSAVLRMLRCCTLGVIRINSSVLFSRRLAASFRGDFRRRNDARWFASGMDSLTSPLVVGSEQTTALDARKMLEGDGDVRRLSNEITWIQGEISK